MKKNTMRSANTAVLAAAIITGITVPAVAVNTPNETRNSVSQKALSGGENSNIVSLPSNTTRTGLHSVVVDALTASTAANVDATTSTTFNTTRVASTALTGTVSVAPLELVSTRDESRDKAFARKQTTTAAPPEAKKVTSAKKIVEEPQNGEPSKPTEPSKPAKKPAKKPVKTAGKETEAADSGGAGDARKAGSTKPRKAKLKKDKNRTTKLGAKKTIGGEVAVDGSKFYDAIEKLGEAKTNAASYPAREKAARSKLASLNKTFTKAERNLKGLERSLAKEKRHKNAQRKQAVKAKTVGSKVKNASRMTQITPLAPVAEANVAGVAAFALGSYFERKAVVSQQSVRKVAAARKTINAARKAVKQQQNATNKLVGEARDAREEYRNAKQRLFDTVGGEWAPVADDTTRGALAAAYTKQLCTDNNQLFPNGLFPDSALCGLQLFSGHKLRPEAARAFDALSVAYAADHDGDNICITDSYRNYAAQVSVKARKPTLAARPGTSNHGLGLAVDLCGGIQTFGTPQYQWMKKYAPLFGFIHPAWAEPGGSKPEPWHWEYVPFDGEDMRHSK